MNSFMFDACLSSCEREDTCHHCLLAVTEDNSCSISACYVASLAVEDACLLHVLQISGDKKVFMLSISILKC